MPSVATYEVLELVDTAVILLTRTFTSSATITAGAFILGDATGGAITLTLPLAGQFKGRTFVISKLDGSANAVTIDGNGSETINGATTYVLNNQYDSVTIRSTGSEWLITATA